MAEAKRLNHSGVAPTTGLASAITASSTGCTLNSGTGYPTANFVIKLDGGSASEEKILCDSRSGTTVTFNASGRGYDGTTATSHSAGPSNVEHCFTAVEADDANRHIYTTTDDDHTQYARTDGTRAFTGGIKVSEGGAAITGDTTITGNLKVTGTGAGVSSYARMAYKSTTQVQVTGTQQVAGNSSDFTGDASSPTYASDALTIKVAGLYLVSLSVAFGSSNGASNVQGYALLYKNGSAVRSWYGTPNTSNGGPFSISGSDIIMLAANDVLTYYVEKGSSAYLVYQGDTNGTATYLSAVAL